MTSSDGTVVTLVDGGTIVDTMGNQWSISASGQVVENGVTDTFTSNVTELAFKNSVIWQENTAFLWYAKVGTAPGAYHGWAAGTYVAPVPVTRGGLTGKKNQTGPATTNSAADAATAQSQRSFRFGASMAAATATLTLPEVVSRFNPFRSARISAAL